MAIGEVVVCRRAWSGAAPHEASTTPEGAAEALAALGQDRSRLTNKRGGEHLTQSSDEPNFTWGRKRPRSSSQASTNEMSDLKGTNERLSAEITKYCRHTAAERNTLQQQLQEKARAFDAATTQMTSDQRQFLAEKDLLVKLLVARDLHIRTLMTKMADDERVSAQNAERLARDVDNRTYQMQTMTTKAQQSERAYEKIKRRLDVMQRQERIEIEVLKEAQRRQTTTIVKLESNLDFLKLRRAASLAQRPGKASATTELTPASAR